MMDKKKLAELSLEDTFSNIDDIMAKLSSSELPLEESFLLYKDGMELINHCNEVIDDVEKQIIILQAGDTNDDDDNDDEE